MFDEKNEDGSQGDTALNTLHCTGFKERNHEGRKYYATCWIDLGSFQMKKSLTSGNKYPHLERADVHFPGFDSLSEVKSLIGKTAPGIISRQYHTMVDGKKTPVSYEIEGKKFDWRRQVEFGSYLKGLAVVTEKGDANDTQDEVISEVSAEETK